MSAWPVRCDPSASFGERCVQVAVSALRAGTLSESSRADVWKIFSACGYAEDISHVKTSCGIFVRAVRHWAGQIAKRSGAACQGGALVGAPSWTDLDQSKLVHAADAASAAVPGAIFWKSNPDHVGVLLRELAPGVWATAEGGGGTGTDCRITWRSLDADFPHLQGIWIPEAESIAAPPEPPSAAVQSQIATSLPILRAGDSGPMVSKMQGRLCAHGFNVTIDGAFGRVETLPALIAFQRAAKLSPVDGVCGHDTWSALLA